MLEDRAKSFACHCESEVYMCRGREVWLLWKDKGIGVFLKWSIGKRGEMPRSVLTENAD